MNRTHCGGCGSAYLQPFLDLGTSPLADRFPATAEEPEDRYPLQLTVCVSCWLVQLTEIVPDGLLYGDDYAFFTGSSPSAVAYFADYAADLDARFGLDGKFVVEVASNDGTMLAKLAERGARVLGVEPALNVAAAARDKGLEIHAVGFGDDAARALVDERGQADLVVANNVAAHVSDLHDFFAGVEHLLAPDGVAVVEVQYLADLLAGGQFDHVYHEHRYYFTADSLARVAARHGLAVRSVTPTPAQGGSIRVMFGRGEPIELSEPAWLRQPSTFMSLQGRVERIRTRLLDLLDEQIAAGRKVAGYAASAKSATLLNYCGIGPDRLDHIVDTTPHKIGRYTPGSKIPVCGPGERPEPDVYLLLAWNYLPGVLRREAAYAAAGGRFLVPLPMPVLL
jgi:SAM-dependent methyltransferase